MFYNKYLQQGKQRTRHSKAAKAHPRHRERKRKAKKEKKDNKEGEFKEGEGEEERRVSVQLGDHADRRESSKLATVSAAQLRKHEFQQQLLQRRRRNVKIGSLYVPGQGGRD